MCGILGVLGPGGGAAVEPGVFRAALSTLTHRGPDEEGAYFGDGVALGIRRLSIVDIAGGHQPVCSEDGAIQVVHNGEIYNHAELRRELEAIGHRFRSRSDAEILPHGYEAWGLDGLLERLRGMFAFAIWDGRTRSLCLARDRMGIKPLYYLERGGHLYFASEIRAILRAANPERRIDLDALALFLRLGYAPAPRTLYAGIHKLPAAGVAVIRGGRAEVRTYWKLSYAPARSVGALEAAEEFRRRMEAAVSDHLMADVPIGLALSGGIDSATIASLMRGRMGRRFPAVTLSFDVEGYDETGRASACAAALGLDLRQARFGEDLMDGYPAVLESLEEPITRATFLAGHQIFRACRELGLKVVMSGEGADELLGGYAWHWNRPIRSGFWNRWPAALRAASSGRHPWVERLVEGTRQWEEGRGTDPKAIAYWYFDRSAAGPKAMTLDLLAPDLRESIARRPMSELLAPWMQWVAEAGSRDPFQQILWLQSRTRLPDAICLLLDKMGMAQSVEVRPPFLDHRLWEYCAGLPRRLKVRGYPPRQSEKFLLREAGRGLVPEVARVAPKTRLRVPFREWLARPRLWDWAEEALSDRALREVGLFDPAAIARLRRRAQTPARVPANLLMGALALQTWTRQSGYRL